MRYALALLLFLFSLSSHAKILGAQAQVFDSADNTNLTLSGAFQVDDVTGIPTHWNLTLTRPGGGAPFRWSDSDCPANTTCSAFNGFAAPAFGNGIGFVNTDCCAGPGGVVSLLLRGDDGHLDAVGLVTGAHVPPFDGTPLPIVTGTLFLTSAVPEPGALLGLAVGGVLLLSRRNWGSSATRWGYRRDKSASGHLPR